MGSVNIQYRDWRFQYTPARDLEQYQMKDYHWADVYPSRFCEVDNEGPITVNKGSDHGSTLTSLLPKNDKATFSIQLLYISSTLSCRSPTSISRHRHYNR
jgi:hypothetical protein